MNQPELTISLLGGLKISLAGTAVTGFASRKAEALFIYLACNPRVHPRETLADLFWPNNDQTRALANLSVALTSLRKQLDDYLVAERHTVGFENEKTFWLDTAVFQQAISQAQEQKKSSGKLSRTGAAQLAAAVSLYEGDFLSGFNIRGAPEFEAWVLLEQERLRQQMLNALSDLITFQQQRGNFAEGIGYAQRLIGLDPLHEEAHHQLMLLYALDNQRSAALTQYEQCAAILAEELGVEPDDETTALYEQIKDEKGAWTPKNLKTSSPKHNLPAANTTFIGRDAELTQIEHWLAEPNGRLLTIVGQGGMGKTRLAQEAARAQIGHFADGVWFASLVPLANVDELVTAVAEVVGLTFAGSLDPAQQLASYLADKEMLLILDNFEHLPTEASLALLTDILQKVTELKLLITSRERLNLQAEWLVGLVGLPFPAKSILDTDDWSLLTDYPAVQLFTNRARRLRPEFELDGVETAVIKLCQLVEGLPLAIELAATWIRTLSVAEIVKEIERGIDVLATSWRDMPERHRSLRAVCVTSWEMLSPDEQDVFSRLSVCRGGFTREAAAQIAAASLAVLGSLVDKSFIRLDGAAEQQARYRRHPLLIQFAAEQLATQPEKWAESLKRLTLYIADALAERTDHFYSPKRTTAMVFMTAEHENVRLAWQWAIKNEPSLLEKMTTSYQYYLIGVGLFPEGYDQFSQAVAALDAPSYQLLRARLQVQLCMFARIVGQTAVGKEFVLDSLAILDRVSDGEHRLEIEGLALKQYAALLMSDDNNYPEAKKADEQALELFQKLNNPVWQGEILHSLGANAYFTGKYAEAIRLAQQGLVLQQRAGNQIGQMLAKQVLGLIYTSLGNFTEAVELFHDCIALAEAAKYKVDLPWHHLNLGYAYLLAGQFEAAMGTLQLSVQYSVEQGDPQAISAAHLILGNAFLHNGRYPEAQFHGQQGLHFSQEPELQFPFYHGFALNLLGATALGQEQNRQAFDQLAQSADLFREIAHQEYLGWSLLMQLIAAVALGRVKRARKLVEETAVLAQKLNAYMPTQLALTALAVWCCQQKQPETGYTLWAKARQAELVAHSIWFQAIADRFICPATSTLSQEQLAQTKARGNKLNFEQLVKLATE